MRATSNKTPSAEKCLELEGLRGLAASMVVVFHILLYFYPVIFFGLNTEFASIQHNAIESRIYGAPIVSLVSGPFAVAIFFVLSGFVLSVAYFQRKTTEVVKNIASRRYLRLMIPAAVSLVVVWVIVQFHPTALYDTQKITGTYALKDIWKENMSLPEVITYSIYGSLFTKSDPVYNYVVWTMHYEFIGSMIIFGFLLVFADSRKRWLLYILLSAALFSTWYLGFIMGMVVADLYVNRRKVLQKIKQRYYFLLLLFGIFLGSYPIATTENTIYSFMPRTLFDGFERSVLSIGALGIVMSALYLKPLSRMLVSKMMVLFGKHTFSLYLVHLPVLLVLTTWLFLQFINHMSYNYAVLLASILTLPVIALITTLYYRLVELPSLKLAAYVGKVYRLGKEPIMND